MLQPEKIFPEPLRTAAPTGNLLYGEYAPRAAASAARRISSIVAGAIMFGTLGTLSSKREGVYPDELLSEMAL
jgi:hypothetical protein